MSAALDIMQDQSSNNRRIARNTIYLYMRSIVLLLINLYTSRVTLQVLGVEDYGIYQIVGGVVSIFSMLSSTLASASQRFITYSLGENDIDNTKKVFSTCISLHIVLGSVIVLILEVLGVYFLNHELNIPPDRLKTAGYVMQFSIATFFVNVISVPFNAAIIAHEKMNAFAFIGVLEGVLKLGAVLLLTVIGFDKLLLYSLFYFLIAVLLRIIYSIYSSVNFEEARRIKLSVDKNQFKSMFAFAGWNMIGSSAMVLRNQGVDIILNIVFGVTVNAAKGVCNQVQAAASQLIGNFTTAVRPQLVQSIASRNYERAHELINVGTRTAFMLMMIISVPLILSCDSILKIWLIDVPEYTELMVKLSFIYLLFTTQSRFLIDSVLAYGEIKWFQIILGGIKLLAIPLTWGMIKLTESPYSGVFVITILQFICLFGELFFANKYISIDWKYFLRNCVFRCWGCFLIAFVPLYMLFKNIDCSVLLEVAVAIFASIVAIYIIGLDIVEKHKIKSVIRAVFKR